MYFTSIITDIKTTLFGCNKPSNDKSKRKIYKITPKFEDEYMPELEACEGQFYKRLKKQQMDLELYSKSKLLDIENINDEIICGELIIDIQEYDNYKIIENYVTIINYIDSQNSEKIPKDLPLIPSNMIGPYNPCLSSDISGNYFIDTPLNLSSNNIV